MNPDHISYEIRLATPGDAKTIAHQRARMFRDMGSVTDAEAKQLFEASIPWLERLLLAQEYVGWLAHCDGRIVAGGGALLLRLPPMPGCCAGGRGGHIVNIYTEPAHRRRGLARRVMELILAWADAEHLDRLTLTASAEGRPLYESLGFKASNEMHFR